MAMMLAPPPSMTASTPTAPLQAPVSPMVLYPVPGKNPREVELLLFLALSNGANPRTIWTKLFVGGLPYHTTDEELAKHFEQYGEIKEAAIIIDKDINRSKGFGFVSSI